MYGYQVREYSYATLERNHGSGGREISVKGRLHANEFVAMVQCLLRSIDLQRRFRRSLEDARYDADTLHEPVAQYGGE